MEQTVPSHDPFDRVRAMLASLGYSMSEEWTYGTLCDAVVMDGDTDVCRIQFSWSQASSGWDLQVRPVDPYSTQTIVRAGERKGQPDLCFTLEEIDHVESLFRALRVREGHLHQREFASDYALRQWAAKASTMMLPRERAPRRPRAEDVVIRPGESPARLYPPSSRISQGIVQAARLLDMDFNRDRAIEVAFDAARQTPEQGDAGMEWLATSARVLLRGRRRDMDLAWDNVSHDRVLLGLAGPRDDMRVPMDPSQAEEYASPAPGM